MDIFDKLAKKLEKREAGSRLTTVSKSEWEHKHEIMSSDELKDVSTMDFATFLNKELALANITDDFYLQMKIEQVGLTLVPMFQMAKRVSDKTLRASIEDLFASFYIRFMAELKMTRSKDGLERKLQAKELISTPEKRGFMQPKRREPSEKQSVEEVELYG